MSASPTISAGNGQRRGRAPLEPLRRRLGPRPTVGPGEAAKAVAEDAAALVRAEIELAKAEVTASLKAKAKGSALLGVAGVLGWLGLQALLVTIALLLALVVPLWAAAAIVTAALLLPAAGLALGARTLLATPVSLTTTRDNVEEDVECAKTHLRP